MLVVAAEDYTGFSPPQAPGPHYLGYYLDALAANGVAADVYDVDARARRRRSPRRARPLRRGDLVHRRRQRHSPAGQGGGNADRLAMDEILEFRAYMNEGGRVAYTGAWAGQQFVRAGAVGQQFYDPKGVGPCNPRPAGLDPLRAWRPPARRQRRDQRRAPVLVGRVRTSPADGGSGHRRPLRRRWHR